jgi:DNA-binding LacI/PurR family transcriptional regulator
MLLDLLEGGEERVPPVRVVLRSELVVRDSVRRLAG